MLTDGEYSKPPMAQALRLRIQMAMLTLMLVRLSMLMRMTLPTGVITSGLMSREPQVLKAIRVRMA